VILYKYVSFKTAETIIRTSTIGFSRLEDLNDPFEGTSTKFEDQDDIPASVISTAVRKRMSSNFAVLSLTKTPLNPTMWSHYGDEHRGVVIGIDVNLANLNTVNSNIIPAKHGDVIYTRTIPSKPLPTISPERLMEIGNEIEAFEGQDFEIFKRTFLYKSLPWNYEEEVRIVKNINTSNYQSRYSESKFDNKSGQWSSTLFQGRPIFCLNIPQCSIKEVYLGSSTFKNVTRLHDVSKDEYLKLKNEWIGMGISVFNVRQIPNSWQLERYIHINSQNQPVTKEG